MGFYDFINTLIGPVLDPLKSLGPFYVILLISFLVSIVITVVYKYATNQKLMKSLKEEIKELQNDMKKHRNKPDKMMKIQKEAMDKNLKYMMHSFRATLITFIPLILIFGWLNTNFAYEPIAPGEQFSTYVFLDNTMYPGNVSISVPEGIKLLSGSTAQIQRILRKDIDDLPFSNPYLMSSRYGGFLTKDQDISYAGWNLSADKEGEYELEFNVSDSGYYEDVVISRLEYGKPLQAVDDGIVRGIMVDEGKLIVMNLFGWKLGWLGAYIIFSIIFSMVTRKLMKVY